MLASLLLEGSQQAQKEIDSLVGALRAGLPWFWSEPNKRSKEDHHHHRHDSPQRQQSLRAALVSSGVVDGVGIWKTRLLSSVSVIQFGGVATAALSCMSPQGPGCCDFNKGERVANVLTSLPYAAIGLHSIRRRRTAAGKLWGCSMLGVCGASITFHVSSGKWRDLGRKLDYWMIAASSGLLTRALYPNLPPAATAATIALTPFRPFLVSAGNAMAMESKFLQRSFANPDLRGAQKLHSAACLAGMAVFAVEDASVPHVPLVHATWHCLSALGTSLVNAVLADAEELHPELTLDALGDGSSSSSSRGRQLRRQQQQGGDGWVAQDQQQQQQQAWQPPKEFDVAPLGIQV
ncbi:hypothetical protein OEZ85_004242 [Tetradesmus obliquus]|uniref:Transmembrane protein 135 N-terminal domain-containing protein n=1 Tax=Tetradesmus obliquus TaxID=3088 RepID=A0ABY8UK58_TETOB|nr:hypothetical protein OEZ85_004242 [Tetradesmus obliquus]